MTTKQIWPSILLIVLWSHSCVNDSQKASPKPSSPSVSSPPSPAPSQETAPAEPQEKKEDIAGKSMEKLRENKSGRIGTIPTGKDAELNTTLPAPPTKVTGKPVARVGPPGYITKKDILLQTDPSPNAPKVGVLKQYEIVYILETIMTDEQGHSTQYPTWYKVERENKERGWVVARAVNAGAGG